MTIGRPQGSAWIGKPLDMVVPLSLDAGEPGDSLCLEAEILQGDTRLPDRSVTVSLDPGPSPTSPRLHVRSTVAVDEPVVTLTVRAGCETKSIRSYVLLADLPVESAVAAAASSEGRRSFDNATPAAPRRSTRSASQGGFGGSTSGTEGSDAVPSVRRAAPAARQATVDGDAPARPQVRAPAAPRRPAAVKTVKPSVATPQAPSTPAAVAPREEAAPGRARLQLDAMEPVAAAQSGLKIDSQLTVPGTIDPAKRAEAAAQWRALNPDPEAAQRMQALEATLAALREQTAQNQRSLLEMRSELAEARDSRYRNPFIYGLIGLLLIAIVALILLWRLLVRRASESQAWWGEAQPRAGASAAPPGWHEDMQSQDAETAKASQRSSANSTTFGAAPFGDMETDADSDYAPPEAHPLPLPDIAPVRPVNTEELFDVQQQSDFFLSLGQHEQAIAVLREHISANPGTSALAYLDLLRIFHTLDRKDDYAHLASEFERAFNADVPAFENFNETAGKGLEHYRATLARIESQWPAPGTLSLIEELVFRKPGAHEEEAFDLAAYQELLLLYSVAKEVIDPDRAPPAPVTPQSFVDTFVHDEASTTPAPLERESAPLPFKDGPELPASIYGAIDDSLQHQTELGSPEQVGKPPGATLPAHQSPAGPGANMDLAQFDKTAFETMPVPMEEPKPPATPASDPHLIDFDLFDPSTEAEIAPRPIKR